MFYRSERLFLRPAFPEDAGELYLRICDASVVAMLSRAPWPYRPVDAEEACSREPDPQAPSFLITLPGAKGAPIIGGVGFKHEGDEIEMGYWIARDHRGNGYATEAGRAALE